MVVGYSCLGLMLILLIKFTLCAFFTGITAVGTWKDLQLNALENPNHRKLAAKLPDTIVRSCADSKVGKYLGAFRRWEAWAIKQGFESLPARDYQLALYLQHLGDYKI